MRVIFLKDIKNVGRVGDIKEVTDGYAKNFLLPKRFAKLATKESLGEMNQKTAAEEKTAADFRKKIEVIKNTPLTFHLKTGEKGEVYNSVTETEIEKELKKKNFGKVKVHLEKPIRTFGEYEVEIGIGHGTTGIIRITVE
ncbi:MAG: 50S ribosomal protein L9 [Parcubacteria group bacterium]